MCGHSHLERGRQRSSGLRAGARVAKGTAHENKTKTKKTLRLNPETLRVLKTAQMGSAVGGYIRRDSDCDTCAERGC